MLICSECGFSGNNAQDSYCRQCFSPLGTPTGDMSAPAPPPHKPVFRAGDGLVERYQINVVFSGAEDSVYYSAVSEDTVVPNRKTYPFLIAETPLADPHPLTEFRLSDAARARIRSENPFGPVSVFLAANKMNGLPMPVECFEEDGHAYLVLENQGLHPVSEAGTWSEAAICSVAAQLCRILSVVHRAGLVHNGIDPSNVWVDQSGQAWLFGWNRMRPAGAYDPRFPIFRSEGFAAPELKWMNSGSVFDPRSDIYAVGCLMYFLLTGKPFFFQAQRTYADGTLILYPDVLVSPTFERILSQALTYTLDDRFGSAIEMASALIGLGYATKPLVGSYTDVGRHRELNEDSLLLTDLRQTFESQETNIGLYVVSDGMGGEAAGEEASRIVVRAIAEWVTERLALPSLRASDRVIQPTDSCEFSATGDSGTNIRVGNLLAHAVLHANHKVLDYAAQNPASQGLGATVTAALLVGNILTVGQVGDSRCYVLSRGRLEQISEDHSLVERMVRRGELTPVEARFHPYKNIIYRSIGTREEIEVDIVTRRLQAGDVVMLCSDGLTGMLTDDIIKGILEAHTNPQAAAQELVVAANAAGGEDNISVIVIQIV